MLLLSFFFLEIPFGGRGFLGVPSGFAEKSPCGWSDDSGASGEPEGLRARGAGLQGAAGGEARRFGWWMDEIHFTPIETRASDDAHSLPELVDLKLFRKTILVVNKQFIFFLASQLGK